MKQIRLDVDNVSSCLCTFYNNGKANILIIDSVWTDENHRGQGYGKRLMEKVKDLAKAENVDSIELVVNQDNQSAISLYEGMGMDRTKKYHYRLILNPWKTLP